MLKLYNSLTRQIEDFKPLNSEIVGMYTCGPTVYNFASIGNFRTYFMADLLVRTLLYDGYDVKYIMNITDVGHLTGDNAGDADFGEDRIEKAALRENKTAWEVAQFYTEQFLEDFEALNLTSPEKFARATDHIHEQIALVKRLEEKGYTYQISDGIYFDTSKFPEYGQLSNLDEIKEGARVEINPEKRNARDFALWKFSYPDGVSMEEYEKELRDSGEEKPILRRQMEWESPWGIGFPGWHIECSAMSMKYLGESFDIHTGGIDLKSTHHPNEIAQAEAATGKKFVNYWLHGAFILVQGQKMSKSLKNVYRLYDLEKQGFEPLALRYLYLQAHYRQEMNFTFPALEAAQNALNHLRKECLKLASLSRSDLEQTKKGESSGEGSFEDKFAEAINNDLGLPEALSLTWDLLNSDAESLDKFVSLLHFDEVLGLHLEEYVQENRQEVEFTIPREVKSLIEVREQLRGEKKFAQADQVRNQINNLGFDLEDSENGPKISKISA